MNKLDKRFLLETSIIIAYLREQKEAQIIDSLPGEKYSSVVCLSELYEGIFLVNKDDRKKVKGGIDSFFQDLDAILPITLKEAKVFGKIRSMLRKQGKIIEDIDLFIAATCIVEDLTLVTLNYKHFKRIPQLKIYS